MDEEVDRWNPALQDYQPVDRAVERNGRRKLKEKSSDEGSFQLNYSFLPQKNAVYPEGLDEREVFIVAGQVEAAIDSTTLVSLG